MENRFPFLRSPRVAVMDSPTSPGSSGLGARMPHYRDEDMSAIHKAASVGNLWRVMQILLFRRSSLNDRDKKSRTALHMACGKGHPRVVRLLARRHCLLNLCDIDNKTALIHAIQNEQEECAVILLDHGADPNVMDFHGNTPLHYAVLGQKTAIVEKLLSCMANMEARNKDDFTPLSLAKYVNNEKMVEFLVTRGSKVHRKEGNQQATSEKKGKRRLLKYSGSNNLVTDLQKSLKQAWSKRKSKKVRELTEEEALFRHALKVACYKGHKRVVSQLARRRGLLDLCDTDNKTALIHAIEYEQEECAAILLEHGADANVMDIHGNTALHYAVLSQNTTIAEKLVSCMANLEVRNKDDFTPLSLAKSKNKEKMVEFLLTKGSKDHQMEGNQQSTSERNKERRPLKPSDSNNLVREISEEESLYSKRRIVVSCPTSDNVVFKVEEKNKQTSSKRKVPANVYDGANDDSDRNGLRQQINSEQSDSQQPNDKINENTVFLMNKVEEEEEEKSSKREASKSMYDGADDDSDDDGLSQNSNREQSDNQQPKDNINKNEVILKNKVEEQEKKTSPKREASKSMYDGADDDLDDDGFSQHSNREQTDYLQPNGNINENALILMNKVDEEEEEKSSKREASKSMYDGADDDSDDDGSSQHSNREQSHNQQPKDNINENAVILMKKVEEQEKKTSSKTEVSGNTHDGAEDNSDSVGVRQKGNMGQSEKQRVPINENVNTDRNGSSHWCYGFYSKRRIAVACPTSDNVVFKVEEQEKKTCSKREVSGNMHNGAEENSGNVCVRQKRNIEQSEKQQVPIKEKENSHRNGFPHCFRGFYSKRRIAVACPTSDNLVFMVEGKNKQRSSIKEVSGNIYDGADDDSDRNGLRHQSNSQQTDTQQPSDKINENTFFLMNKVEKKKKQKNHQREESGNIYDRANGDTDSVGGRQKSNSEQNDKHQFPIVENEDSERLTLQEEKETRQKADLLNKKNTGQSRKKERQSIKNVEMNPKVENTTETQVMALKTVRRNKVSDSDEKEKRLLRENHMLKNKIAKLTLEIDTVKNQNPEMEGKKDFEDIVIVNEKIDHFQKTITETLFQHKAQLGVLRAELTMLSSKLEDEQQNRGRLEAEGESHRSRRATVVQDHEHCQTSKGDLQVDFKKEKEEWICSQDKNKSDRSNLKGDFEILSQKCSILESKFNGLEIELHHTRDALRERALVLEDGQRDQSQTQCQKKELENVSQKEQGKVNADSGKQESVQERLSHLQSENKLLQQQLDRAHYKSEKKGKTVIRIQDQFVDTIKILQANSEKQSLMLNETCKELIHECHLLKESRLQYENDKAESDAVVRQLQGELADTQGKLRQLQEELADTQRKLRQLQGEMADTQRKLSMTEASLKVESHCLVCSQHKIQELQKELDESRSQCQHEEEESKKYIDLTISLQQSLHELRKKQSDLEKSMARFQEPLNMPTRNLNEEASFPRDLRPSQREMGVQTSRLTPETEERIAAPTCNDCPEDNTDQLEEEFKVLQKKCEEMTPRAEWWKQEGLRVRRQMEINRAKHLEEEQRLDRIGECERPDLAYRSEQVRQFYQDFYAL